MNSFSLKGLTPEQLAAIAAIINAETAKPAKAETAKPAKAETAKPAKAETAKPAKAETAKPAKAETAKPAKAETAKPAKAETAKPAKAETAKTLKYNFDDNTGQNFKGSFVVYEKSQNAFAIVGEDTKAIKDAFKTVAVWNRFTKEYYMSKKRVSTEPIEAVLNRAMFEVYGVANAIK